MNEVDWRGGVQVPVQLVQNDPLHAKNLCCRKAAPALYNQVFNGAYYLCDELQNKQKKGINIVLNEPGCRSQFILTSSSSLILAARMREVNAMHLRYFG